MRKAVLFFAAMLAMSTAVMAEDHVMAATRSAKYKQDSVPAVLSLSLKEAQDFAVKQNRSLINASIAVLGSLRSALANDRFIAAVGRW